MKMGLMEAGQHADEMLSNLLGGANNIREIELAVKKCSDKITQSRRHLTTDDIYKLKEDLSCNCLKKGDFENCKGTRYALCYDGSDGSRKAFQTAMQKVTPRDHVFVIVCWRMDRFLSRPESEWIILNHIIWQEACSMLRKLEPELKSKKIPYTMMMPGTFDPKHTAVVICRKWKLEGVFVGHHGKHEKQHKHGGHFSFHKHLAHELKYQHQLYFVR
jgi:hypothetical protein